MAVLIEHRPYSAFEGRPRGNSGVAAFAVHRVNKRWRLRSLGASLAVAHRVAANSRRWWCNIGKLLNSVLTLACFDRLGLPRLC